MARHRNKLPHLHGPMFMTDGGLETTLVFIEGVELPAFSAFVLLDEPEGRERLRQYYARYAELARAHGVGLLLESPTWRASPDWGAMLGYDGDGIADANRRGIDLMRAIRATYETPTVPMVISGVVGPRGDGYVPSKRMTRDAAQEYHSIQIGVLASTHADMITAYTLNYIDEAVGIAAAAQQDGMPVALSFTVETDGRLPTGDTLAEAIERTDDATDGYPAYYMINCAHPTHFEPALRSPGPWVERIRGLRANASRLSHAELDRCTELDQGDPQDLGQRHTDLRALLPGLAVVGGCCGTDHRHVEAIVTALR